MAQSRERKDQKLKRSPVCCDQTVTEAETFQLKQEETSLPASQTINNKIITQIYKEIEPSVD